MKIAMIGTGYVGLVTGTCLANLGNEVVCVDVDKEKIKQLNNNIVPIYEPGLRDMIEINSREKRLSFTDSPQEGIEGADVIFIAVGTPSDVDGSADLKYVRAVAKDIGKYINGYKVIVTKSTVPVGTSEIVRDTIKENLNAEYEYDVASNPEFLREGEAMNDFMIPDRVVIGTDSKKAADIMNQIYVGIERTGRPIVHTDIKTAEMIKYASNAMLATRISFMNMLAPLCEKVGANVKLVAKGMGLDKRIGPRFLQAGVGYGGSCFPKDVRALIKILKANDCDASILDSVDNVNEAQKSSIIPKIQKVFPDLKGKTIGIWGLAFKPKTDDMREAPSIIIIKQLQELGAKIKAFDPVARKNASKLVEDVEFTKTPYETVEGCDALVIVTEWDEFRQLDIEKIKEKLNEPVIFDGRNVYETEDMEKAGIKYISVGR